MALQMVASTKHPRFGTYRVRLTVPEHLRETSKRLYGAGRELTQTLGTKDPKEARRLAPAIVDALQAKLRAAEAEFIGQATNLSDREISAFCGTWLAQQEALTRDRIPEPVEFYERRADFLGDVLQSLEDPETDCLLREAGQFMDDDVKALLASAGLKADADSLRRLLSRLAHVQRQHFLDLIQRSRTGSWVSTVSSATFPAAKTRGTSNPHGVGCTFDALLSGWALDRGWKLDMKPMSRALYDRVRTLERLAGFLEHRDASRVTVADAVRWKAEMMGRELHAATVRNDMSEMSAVWKWGVANGVVQMNPFTGIMPPKAKKAGTPRRAFTDAEARTILEAARGATGYMRWVPWVLSATGARLNEIAQASKSDVFILDGINVIRIHDDDGLSVKNAHSLRTVPLHPKLIAEGFLSYVNALPAGSDLWPDMRKDNLFGRRSGTGGRRMANWLRKTVKIMDTNISPNHSWRHTFMDACRRVVMPLEVRSALTGHSGQMDESSSYGAGMGSMVQVLAEHLAKVRALPVD